MVVATMKIFLDIFLCTIPSDFSVFKVNWFWVLTCLTGRKQPGKLWQQSACLFKHIMLPKINDSLSCLILSLILRLVIYTLHIKYICKMAHQLPFWKSHLQRGALIDVLGWVCRRRAAVFWREMTERLNISTTKKRHQVQIIVKKKKN